MADGICTSRKGRAIPGNWPQGSTETATGERGGREKVTFLPVVGVGQIAGSFINCDHMIKLGVTSHVISSLRNNYTRRELFLWQLKVVIRKNLQRAFF